MINKTPKAHSCIAILGAKFSESHGVYIQKLSKHYQPLGYDVRLFIDRLTEQEAAQIRQKYKINIHAVDAKKCENHNYKYCILSEPNKTGGVINVWDKALFLLSNNVYQHYWFLEDDVLFTDLNAIKYIDDAEKKGDYDLLIQKIFHKNAPKAHLPYLWEGFARNPFVASKRWDAPGFLQSVNCIKSTPMETLRKMQPLPCIDLKQFCMNWPLSHSLACTVRFSNKLMNKIKESVLKYERLIFQEYLFGTLALHYNLKVKSGGFLHHLSHTYGDASRRVDSFLSGQYHPGYTLKHLPLLLHPFKNVDKHLQFLDILDREKSKGNLSDANHTHLISYHIKNFNV